MTLAAVQEAARAEASGRAEAIREAARVRAEEVIAAARAGAAALVAERRAAAERLADLEEHERLAQARAQASEMVLSAQRTVLVEARTAAQSAARHLVGDRRYAQLLDQLAADARRRLRNGDPVRIAAAAEGGFVASAGTRQIDYSLNAQVDRCLEAMGPELERLWR